MKRKLIFSAILFSCTINVNAAEWVDSWFNSATYNSGTSFSTQNRKFIMGGSFSARSSVKTDYPITISSPRLSFGCGGIDGFMGGFSFLDADYLVDKAQRMMQAAPYIAVDMALKTMSKEFSDTLKAAEDIIGALNGIQLNECQSMKPLVAATLDRNPEGMKNALGEMVNAKQVRESSVRFWQEATEKGKDSGNRPVADLATEVAGCPADVRDIFGPGSVIRKIAARSNMTDHADLLRGYFGDVIITNNNNISTARPLSPCPQNRDDREGFMYGLSFKKSEAGACTRDIGRSVYQTIYTKIDLLGRKITDNVNLTNADRDFASSGTTLPIFKMLQVAHAQGTMEETKQMLTDITAASYSRRVADDFYKSAYEILKKASDLANTQTQDNNQRPCNMNYYADSAYQVRDLLREVRMTRSFLSKNIDLALNEYTQLQQIVDESKSRRDEFNSDLYMRVRGNN